MLYNIYIPNIYKEQYNNVIICYTIYIFTIYITYHIYIVIYIIYHIRDFSLYK